VLRVYRVEMRPPSRIRVRNGSFFFRRNFTVSQSFERKNIIGLIVTSRI